MNNVKTFKILYYLCFIVNTIVCFFAYATSMAVLGVFLETTNFVLFILNFILFLVFNFLVWKKMKIKKVNILFPILFLIFTLIVMIIASLYNSKVIMPFMHFNYYFSFVFVGYLLLNIYSILSFNKK